MDIKKMNFNPRLLPGILIFSALDVLLIIQLVLNYDFLVQYNEKCLLIICVTSFVLSLIGNLFIKNKYERILKRILIILYFLFFVLVLINCKFIYGVL